MLYSRGKEVTIKLTMTAISDPKGLADIKDQWDSFIIQITLIHFSYLRF